MRCREFKKKVEADVDSGRGVTYTPEMLEHRSTCSECREYVEGLLEFVEQVSEQSAGAAPPDLKMLPEVIIGLEAAGAESDDWKEDVAMAWKYLLVALIGWIVSLFLSPIPSFALECSIILASVLYLATRAREP
jgi:hypothetical protein